MTIRQFTAHIRNLIARDQLKIALQQLKLFFDDSPNLNEILLQTARYTDIKKQIRFGMISSEDSDVAQNQIRLGVLEFLNEIEKEENNDLIQKEIKRVAKNHSTIIQNAEKIYNIDNIDNANFS